MREAEDWLSHGSIMLVEVRCECRTVLVRVALPCAPAPEDENLLVVCPLGPVVQGTRRHSNADWIIGAAKGTHRFTRCSCPPGACVTPEHQLTGEPARKVPKVDASDDWTALLDRVTDKTLPAWCNTHGDRQVSVAELKRRAAAVAASPTRKVDSMETIPTTSTGHH